ncbi:MAG: DUF4115 domain-containing protein [Magnetococcales bacterium]|nr:DUF4115 domain-containing protein [Magnetococcales bacterium]
MAQAPDDFFSAEEVNLRNGGPPSAPETSAARDESIDALQVGILLRKTREDNGWSIEEMAQRTRIRDVHLISLEAGEPEKLPGSAFIAGFLRLYTKSLNLVEHPLITRFLLEFEQKRQNLTTETFTPPTKSRQRPNSGAIIGGLVGLVALSVAYSNFDDSDSDAQKLPEAPPAKVGEIVPIFVPKSETKEDPATSVLHFGKQETAPVTVQRPTEGELPLLRKKTEKAIKALKKPVEAAEIPKPDVIASTETVLLKPEKEVVTLKPKKVIAPAPVEQKEEVVVLPQTSSISMAKKVDHVKIEPKIVASIKPYQAEVIKPQIKAVSRRNDDSHLKPRQRISQRYPEPIVDDQDLIPDSSNAVSLISKELVWVQIRDEEGDVLKDMVMQPNHIFRVPTGMQFYAIFGNAGGVQVRIGKKRLGYLGKPGDVIQDLDLAPSALLEWAAKL